MKKEKKMEEAGNGAPAMTNIPPQPAFVPFNKATLEEKVERCHFVIRDLIEAMNKVQKDQSKLEANFYNHKHYDNTLMHQLTQFGNGPEGKEKDTRTEDEKWF